MSKLYHVTVQTYRGSWHGSPVNQYDVLGSNIAIAVKRALKLERMSRAKTMRIEVNLSNHGEYDKATFHSYAEHGGMVYPKARDGSYYRAPAHIRRAEQVERLGIEAQRILYTCPEVQTVKAHSKYGTVVVNRGE